MKEMNEEQWDMVIKPTRSLLYINFKISAQHDFLWTDFCRFNSILVDVLLKGGYAIKRIGPDACHQATELLCAPIREELKAYRDGDESEKHIYKDIVRPGKRKVAIVKLVSGQGAMYDTHFLSKHPSGFDESRSIIDSVGSPIILSANEYRDGALRCMYG